MNVAPGISLLNAVLIWWREGRQQEKTKPNSCPGTIVRHLTLSYKELEKGN